MNRDAMKHFMLWSDRNHDALVHYANGGEVQVKYGLGAIRPVGHSDEWNDTDEIFPMNYRDREYRQKPVPRKLFAVYNSDDMLVICSANEKTSGNYAKSMSPPGTVVPMEEKL